MRSTSSSPRAVGDEQRRAARGDGNRSAVMASAVAVSRCSVGSSRTSTGSRRAAPWPPRCAGARRPRPACPLTQLGGKALRRRFAHSLRPTRSRAASSSPSGAPGRPMRRLFANVVSKMWRLGDEADHLAHVVTGELVELDAPRSPIPRKRGTEQDGRNGGLSAHLVRRRPAVCPLEGGADVVDGHAQLSRVAARRCRRATSWSALGTSPDGRGRGPVRVRRAPRRHAPHGDGTAGATGRCREPRDQLEGGEGDERDDAR